MKSTIELQQEVRAIEEEMRKLSTRLGQLSSQLAEAKSAEELSRETLATLDALAAEYPVKNPAIGNLLPSQRETYFRLLCTAASLSGDSIDKLLYLCRLSVGSGGGFSALPLQRMAYQTDKLDWRVAASNLKDCRNPLLLDMLTVTGINGSFSEQAIDFSAEIAALLECTEDDFITISQLSAALLSNSFKLFQAIQPKKAYSELGYLISPEWLKHVRKNCGSFEECKRKTDKDSRRKTLISFVSSTIEIGKKTLSNGTFVKTGQELFVYSYDDEYSAETRKRFPLSPPITAPCDGIVYYKRLSKDNIEVDFIDPDNKFEIFNLRCSECKIEVYIESPFAPMPL